MAIWAGITNNEHDLTEYDVLDVQESWGKMGFKASVIIRVPFSGRFAKAYEMKGGLSASGYRIRPMQYGPFPLAVCTDVNIVIPEPLRIRAAATPTAADPWEIVDTDICHLQVTFETIPWEGSGIAQAYANVSERIEGTAEFITVPNGNLFWDSTHTQRLNTSQRPGQIIRMKNWILTFRQIPTAPNVNVFDNMGKCNSEPLTSEKYGITFAAETLLWGEPNLSENAPTEGVSSFDLDIPLTHKPHGWNKFFGKPNIALVTASNVYSDESGATPAVLHPPVAFSNVLDTLFATAA